MVDSVQVALKIRDYLDGRMNLDAFRRWIVQSHIEIANAKENSDESASRLIAVVEARYAELSDGVIEEHAWKRYMRALLAPRPQSVESLFLTYFYAPSETEDYSSVKTLSSDQGASNSNGFSNYGQVPESEAIAA